MTGLKVTMPFASWRGEFARQHRTTHPVPPPATVYGFLLSLIGEENRSRYYGSRVTAGVVGEPSKSTILRKLRRHIYADPNSSNDFMPGYQEILTDVTLVVWVHGSLEAPVVRALTNPETVDRFGALSLGESSFLVNTVKILDQQPPATTFLLDKKGDLSLPAVPDYAANLKATYQTGRLELIDQPPDPNRLPLIAVEDD